MLHEILLSLAGHPSPLLQSDPAASDADKHPATTQADAVFSPPERELLATVSHLSGLHIRLLGHTAHIAASHPSTICRAVAASISSVHLAAFQRKVLEVENSVLRRDAALVGAYDIVPLTAVVGEFSDWTRRMEWLWDIVRLMLSDTEAGSTAEDGKGAAGPKSSSCTGAVIINRLRDELQTGYSDIQATAPSLVAVAETAWLKQVSSWILYGRLPTFGAGDFFIQKAPKDNDEGYVCFDTLLPNFVTPSAASSMLFIGISLNQIRAKGLEGPGLSLGASHHLSSQLPELSKLTFPLDGAVFARTVTKIRLFLSRNILQKLLPLAKVLEMLSLLRDFFLLGRGDFAMALTQQADEKMRSRWRRADNLDHVYGKQDGIGNVLLKDGEVMQVLARTWGALGSLQGQHSSEDEGLELARDIIRLTLAKAKTTASSKTSVAETCPYGIATTPFRNLLLSIPTILTLNIPSPLDLFLSLPDLQTYTFINSYLLSIRRSHLRLTDLWKITSLRKHWPAPPRPPQGSSGAGRERTQLLRRRQMARSNAMRSAWATASAAIFFLAETEGYLQTEVVAGLWDGFQQWLLTGSDRPRPEEPVVNSKSKAQPSASHSVCDEMDIDLEEQPDDDLWLTTANVRQEVSKPLPVDGISAAQRQPHDPQTLAAAHRLYLRTLVRRLLLADQSFTDVLYELLVDVDQLVALAHRLQAIWTSADLEADSGVVEAFVDLEREEADVRADVAAVERSIRRGVAACMAELRVVEARHDDDYAGRSREDVDDAALLELGEYMPRRVGRVDRLLMKLDFGSWFELGRDGDVGADGEDYDMER